MDESILSDDLRLSAHVARARCRRRPGPRARAVSRVAEPAPRRGHRGHHLPRPRRPHRGRGRVGRPHLQLPGHRHIGRRLLGPRAGSTISAPRCGCSSHVRLMYAGCGPRGSATAARFAVCEAADDELVHGVASIAWPSTLPRLGAGPGRLLRTRPIDGHDPHPGLPDATPPAGYATSVGSTRSPPRARFDGRPLLVLHGVEDAEVPVEDARSDRRRRAPGSELRSGARRRPPAAPRSTRDRDAAGLAGPPGAGGAASLEVPASSRSRVSRVAASSTSASVSREVVRRLPPGGRDELGGIADEDGDVDGPGEGGVGRRRAAGVTHGR